MKKPVSQKKKELSSKLVPKGSKVGYRIRKKAELGGPCSVQRTIPGNCQSPPSGKMGVAP
jgi:hypothetical protein